MKRDMDLVREILLKAEDDGDHELSYFLKNIQENHEYEKIVEHMRLLIDDAQMLTAKAAHTYSGKNWIYIKLTWKGHEYLDNIRDPEIWRKTKEGAAKAGGFSLELMGALAKGLIKKQIQKYTDVEIEL